MGNVGEYELTGGVSLAYLASELFGAGGNARIDAPRCLRAGLRTCRARRSGADVSGARSRAFSRIRAVRPTRRSAGAGKPCAWKRQTKRPNVQIPKRAALE